jgi:uncharacterized protein YcfL
MRKWGLSLLVCFLLMGCSAKPKDSITGFNAVDPIEYLSTGKAETTSVFTGRHNTETPMKRSA